jgi:hypothetical protein
MQRSWWLPSFACAAPNPARANPSRTNPARAKPADPLRANHAGATID